MRWLKDLILRWRLPSKHRNYLFWERSMLHVPGYYPRRAFLWDGKPTSRSALKEFLGELPVRWFGVGGRTAMAFGYGELVIEPGHFIWTDSDGFDAGSMTQAAKRFDIEVDHELIRLTQSTKK